MTTTPFNQVLPNGVWTKVLANVKDYTVFNESTATVRVYVATDGPDPTDAGDGWPLEGGFWYGTPMDGSVWMRSDVDSSKVSGYGTP